MNATATSAKTANSVSFSLRDILVAVMALAVGFSIWRLPKGDWIDIPVWALSFYFALSLLRHAAVTRRLLIDYPDLPKEQRWGGRLLLTSLIGLAMILLIAFVMRFLAANEILLITPTETFIDYVQFAALPRDLAVLAMLSAIGLGARRSSSSETTPRRQRIYAVCAAIGALIGLILYWADRMIIPALVYIAVSGIEMAQPPRLLPPELNVSSALRMHRFTIVSFLGLLVVVVNLLLIFGVVKSWHKGRQKSTLFVALIIGVVAEFWVVRWLTIDGIRQLSAPFQETIRTPSSSAIMVVAMTVLLAAAAFSWRSLATPASGDRSFGPRVQKPFFYESWIGSLFLGAVAVAQAIMTLVNTIVEALNPRFPFFSRTIDFQTLLYGVTLYPAQLLWLAAALGGFILAWHRWRRRNEPVGFLLPSINPAVFAVTMFSLTIVVVAAAPIVAAVSFSCLFVRFE